MPRENQNETQIKKPTMARMISISNVSLDGWALRDAVAVNRKPLMIKNH
jgi:hypothetical protein